MKAGILGALIGFLPFTIYRTAEGLSGQPDQFLFNVSIMLGILGLVAGLFIGESIAFKYKLQAQLVLVQMQIEKNTRQVGSAAAGG